MGPNTSVSVDLCINATTLTSGAEMIPRANYTFANSTISDIDNPAGPSDDLLAIPDAFVKYSEGIPSSGRVYHRFWLDIPPPFPFA